VFSPQQFLYDDIVYDTPEPMPLAGIGFMLLLLRRLRIARAF
jgi:hypothetical protein